MKKVSKKAAKKKTPKVKEVPLVFKESEQVVDLEQAKKVYETLNKSLKTLGKSDKTNLFANDGQRINIQITGIKLPGNHRQQLLRIHLPHECLPKENEVCLFVKDFEKGIRPDHDKTKLHHQELLEKHGITGITVIPLRQLKVEYKEYAAKTALCHQFDKYLCDDRIVRLIPKFLGKAFYKRKRFPIPVNMKAKDLKKELNKGIQTATLPLSHHGVCSMVEIGHSDMSTEQIGDNISELCSKLAEKYPGGLKNIRSMYMKAEKSMAIPIYINTISPNEVGQIEANIPKRKGRKNVTDELSTQPGKIVTVTPEGKVIVKKVSNEIVDDEKDEPFIDGSDEEENEEDVEDQKKENKKRKRDKDSGKEQDAKVPKTCDSMNIINCVL